MTEPFSTQPNPNRNLSGQPATQEGLVKSYPVRHQKINHSIATPIGILLILLAIVALIYGAFTTWSAVERFGRAVILRTLPTPTLIFFLGLLLGSLILSTTLRHWRDGIELGPDGLSFRRGRVNKEIPWESITRLDARINLVKFATSVIEVQTKAEIENDRGETFLITDHIAHSQDLINRCREIILPRLFQKYQKSLLEGETITFHRELAATHQALLIHNMPYNWGDLTPKYKKRRFTLREKSSDRELISLPINRLENADILLTLLENPPKTG